MGLRSSGTTTGSSFSFLSFFSSFCDRPSESQLRRARKRRTIRLQHELWAMRPSFRRPQRFPQPLISFLSCPWAYLFLGGYFAEVANLGQVLKGLNNQQPNLGFRQIGVYFSQSPSAVPYRRKIDSERTSGLFRPDQLHSSTVSEAEQGGLHRSVCDTAQAALYLLNSDSV